jgi:hypothetical protein
MDADATGGERKNMMIAVDITADLHDEDETGYVWTSSTRLGSRHSSGQA